MGDMKGRITLVAFMMFTIASLGLSSPAYAGFFFPENPPTDFLQNFVHAGWACQEFDPVGDQFFSICVDESNVLPESSSADTLNFDLYTTAPFVTEMNCDGNSLCTFNIANLVDNLEFKIIEIEIEYDFDTQSSESPPRVEPVMGFDDADAEFPPPPSPCLSLGAPVFFSGEDPEEAEFFFDSFTFFFGCEPNPDWEQITIQLDANAHFVEFWTESFDEEDGPPVGGAFVPIDNSALLLAGVSSISMWMIPVVIAGIGVTIFVVKRRN